MWHRENFSERNIAFFVNNLCRCGKCIGEAQKLVNASSSPWHSEYFILKSIVLANHGEESKTPVDMSQTRKKQHSSVASPQSFKVQLLYAKFHKRKKTEKSVFSDETNQSMYTSKAS